MPGVAPDEAEADDLIGVLVDERYKVLEAMASGSMGAVYKAERIPVGKIVAIKFLHASFANDAEFLARFERETRVMSKLAHPNCVSVVDFGVFEGSPYIVMEYVAGITLRALLDLGPVKPSRALVIARQIAAGLAHAHAQGIVHRDVKPANIMITEEIGTGEHARILDFGLARLRGAVGRDATQTNVVVGTPNYMAPEQTIGGGTIDARTDVYAVGVVLFEMIAGERPFQADDTLALLGMHRAAPIPKLLDRVGDRVDLPEGLQAVVEKAMAKSPDDRYQSVIELAEAIDVVSGARQRAADLRTPAVARKTGPTAMAATVRADLGSQTDRTETLPRRKGSMAGPLLVVVLLGGGAAGAWYLKGRDSRSTPVAGVNGSGGQGSAVVASGGSAQAQAQAQPVLGPAVDAAAEPAISPPMDVATDSAFAVEIDAAPAAAGSGELAVGSGAGSATAGSNAGSAGGEIDMAPDPNTAENPVPPKVIETDDEAADAPETEEDADKRAPKAPVLAASIHDAVQQIKDGKADLAIASLRALWKTNSRSAYIPFLLGNLYYDKLWWSVAMDHYRLTIAKNPSYRNNPTLNRNIIRMLASKKTSGKAQYFLRKTIGKPAVAYLRVAAKYDSNLVVKRLATDLAKAIR
jgi:serine/threonine-protein kinase